MTRYGFLKSIDMHLDIITPKKFRWHEHFLWFPTCIDEKHYWFTKVMRRKRYTFDFHEMYEYKTKKKFLIDEIKNA